MVSPLKRQNKREDIRKEEISQIHILSGQLYLSTFSIIFQNQK